MPLRVLLVLAPTPLDSAMLGHGPSQLGQSGKVSASFADVVPSKCCLDKALETLQPSEHPVVVCGARHFAWMAAWASARNIPQNALLNTGATALDGSDLPSAAAIVGAVLRHAAGPLGLDDASTFPVDFDVRDAAGEAVGQPLRMGGRADEGVVAQLLAPVLNLTLASPANSSFTGNDGELQQWRKSCLATRPSGSCLGFSFARVGLMGNPSDQLHGKSLAVTVSNFWARCIVEPAAAVTIVAHPIADQDVFASTSDLFSTVVRNGYSGGKRLVLAAIKRFHQMCVENSLASAEQLAAKPFKLEYDTNVPRQVGLAGSSCIVSSIFKALAAFYGVELDLNVAPSSVLAAEWNELGIHAGLMDRVAQVWGGLVSMDFDRDYLEASGYGRYQRHDLAKLPEIHLAYAMDPSDSGKIHNDVKARYAKGDDTVVQASRTWAGYVDQALDALDKQDHAGFADLVDKNFDLRRSLYGDQCLGWKNLDMVEIARRHGAAAKFPGSGGAILVVPRAEANMDAMRADMQSRGYVLVRLRPVEGTPAQ